MVKVKGRKIRKSNANLVEEVKDVDVVSSDDIDHSMEEEQLDKEINVMDNLSVGFMILILIGCLILGVGLGYVLYRLAMNSSALIFVRSFLK